MNERYVCISTLANTPGSELASSSAEGLQALRAAADDLYQVIVHVVTEARTAEPPLTFPRKRRPLTRPAPLTRPRHLGRVRQRPPREAPPRTAEAGGSGSAVCAGPFILGAVKNTATAAGTAPDLLAVTAAEMVAGATPAMLFTVTGITNRSLRALP